MNTNNLTFKQNIQVVLKRDRIPPSPPQLALTRAHHIHHQTSPNYTLPSHATSPPLGLRPSSLAWPGGSNWMSVPSILEAAEGAFWNHIPSISNLKLLSEF